MKRLVLSVLGACVVASGLSIGADASARTDVFVHGRNNGTADVNDYWHVGYGNGNDGVLGFSGQNQETTYTYGYDASQNWSQLNSDSLPVCQFTHAMYNAPGTDIAVVAHSAGGMVAVYSLAIAQNGWATSCAVSPASAKQWQTYTITNATPFRGAQVADAVYGGTSGNWLQMVCGSVAGSIANLLFNQASNMTWSLQRSYMANNFNSLVAYGSYGSIYSNAGTGTGGDDGTALNAAQWCAGEEGNNDGFVSCNSALGATKGSTCGTNGLPNGHPTWWDGVSHSSNRRDDYRSFATNVWNRSPY